MQRLILAAGVAVSLMLVACGSSRQSGICGDINPTPTGQGDASALEQQADVAWAARGSFEQASKAVMLWEEILTVQPNRPDIRTKLARAHYFIADSHLWFRLNVDEDETAAPEMLAHYQEGTNQAEVALGQQYAGFRSKYCARQPFETALQQLDKEAVGAMYWYATNLGRYALQKSLVEVLNQKDRIKAMMDTVKRLDSRYWYFAADRYLGAYFTKIPFPSGDLPKSRTFFDASVAGAPQYLATKVVMARMNVAKAGDRALFKKLLDEVIAFDLTVAPEIDPENAAEQRKAQYYLDEIDFIVESE